MASPGGLGDALPLRKYIGRALDLRHPGAPLDVHPLAVNTQLGAGEADQDDAEEVREQLLTVKDPEDLLGYYLTAIQKFPLLNAEEEVELAKRIEAGLYATQLVAELTERGHKLPAAQRRDIIWICRDGDRAKNHFLAANLRLVVSLAKRYSPRIEIMDAIQEGNLGLIRAVEKFDYTKGYKFSTYATWWIRQAITRGIADQTYFIRLPVHLFESDGSVVTELRRARESENPSAADIASTLDLAVTDVEAIMRRHRRPYSLEVMVEEGFDLIDPLERTVAHEQVVHCHAPGSAGVSPRNILRTRAGVIRCALA